MKSQKHNGFTLIELMITLAIVGILALVALPGMSNFIKNERLVTDINGLLSYLQYARSEALLRHRPITVCASSDEATCTGAWGDGWIVTVENDDETVTVLKVHAALKGTNTLSSTAGTEITFDRSGFTPLYSGTFSICDDRGATAGKSISISNTGRIRNGGTVTC